MSIDLQATLTGGQCFSWSADQEGYHTVLNGRVVIIKNEADIAREHLESYFDMDYPYGEARSYLASLSPCLKRAISFAPDLHILRQNQWDVTIGFLISQNNNIKRITKLYDSLRRNYGREIEEGVFAFPTPEELSRATEEELRELKFGYRASYIVENARSYEPLVEGLSTDEARKRLMERPGIGPKVADCILLFGCHRFDVFPIDTWMRKVMASYFPGQDPSIFAPYQGLAQQYLFQAAQSGAMPC